MKKFRNHIIILVVLCLTVLTGCGGSGGSESNIDQGMAAIQNLEYGAALEYFEKAVVANEDLELAYRGKGIANMGLTNYEEAIGAFESALSHAGMFPGDLEYDINFYLATAKYKQGDIEGAIAVLDGIIAIMDRDQEAYLLRGSAELKLGNFAQGKEDLEKVLSLAGKNSSIVIEVFRIMQENGYEQEGTAYLKAALENGTSSLSAYEVGTIYYYLKEYDQARNSLEEANADANEKDSARIILMLGQTYEQLGDSNYAANLYSQYLEKNPDHVEMYYQLGLCKLKAGAYDETLQAFQKAMEITPNEIMQNLKYSEIITYEYLGDFSRAKVLMESYLSAYPDDESARREYEFLKTR